MRSNPKWSLLTTIAINMLDLETKHVSDASWVKYHDVVLMINEILKARGHEN